MNWSSFSGQSMSRLEPHQHAHDTLGEVERRRNIASEEFWERYAIPGVPVVLEGLADAWPARSLWTFDFFRQNYGGRDVTIYPGPRKTAPRMTKLSSYLEYMEQTEDEVPDYLSRWCFSSSFPELAAQYRRPPHFPCWTDRLPSEIRPSWKWLYMGPPRSGSAMHSDFMGTAAWNVLFVGRKTWRFYPPDQRSQVYAGEVDAFQPDYVRFPLFSEAEGLSCVQRPGDIIFTPSNWWHQVRNETCTLALTENIINETNGHWLCADPEDEQEHRLMRLFGEYVPAVGRAFTASSRYP
jgi:cupin-like protein